METGWERRRELVAGDLERRAIAFIAERGFDAVTVPEIAAAAGVSTRTLTRHFPSKDDLLLSLPRRAAFAMADALGEVPMSDQPIADLWGLWVELSAGYGPHLDFFFLWQQAALSAPEVATRARGDQMALLLPDLIERCAHGLGVDANDDVRPHAIAAALLAVNAAVFDFWIDRGGEDDLEQLFAQALEGLQVQFSSPGVRRQSRRRRVSTG